MTIKIEVFSSPGCSKCAHAKEILHRMVKDMGNNQIGWREVNILNELEYAVKTGVLSTPAIAVDGKLVFSGLPSTQKLRKFLENRLEQSAS